MAATAGGECAGPGGHHRRGVPTADHTRYCLVQHSGYGYGGKPMMAGGLELREVSGSLADAVVAAGGVVVSGWARADALAEREMYPPGVIGLIPEAEGHFAALKVDSLAVYVPTRAGAAFAALASSWEGGTEELFEVVEGLSG